MMPDQKLFCYPPADNTIRLPDIHDDIAATTSGPVIPNLNALGLLILIDAAIGALGINTSSLREVFEIFSWAVEFLLEDGLLLNLLELGLEILQTGRVAAAVGATACIGKIEAFVLDFFAIDTPL
jgi:hypothetical protein